MNIEDSTTDTLAALATGASPAGVAIIRIAGLDALKVARALAVLPDPMPPRRALLRALSHPSSGEHLDEAIVLYFQAPASFTGEDIVELQCHGGLLQVESILDAALAAGARAAGPGELTRRAFLNGRISLERAEALADLVGAETKGALKAARAQMFGALGQAIDALSASVLALRAEIEALLDFPEDLELLDVPLSDFAAASTAIAERCAALRSTHHLGRALREGVRIAIAGAPNAGKSSLFNALVGEARALTDEEAGTTRDAIEARVDLEGIPCTLVDTAGLREVGVDRIERQGIERARGEIGRAALCLWVIDPLLPVSPDDGLEADLLIVENKRDLGLPSRSDLRVSARTGEGIDALKTALVHALRGDAQGIGGEAIVTNRRHAQLLERAEAALRQAAIHAREAPLEICAYDLRDAAGALDQILGKEVDDALLDEIFSKFCIGK
ncbi:MAG: tRNA uridine-5-carboxymethylaminomethyl(34) synthesis GTPase MnmE [Myxococcales bacterium]|jgi:tRNA modification GTPase|nr:tRNA uridine-5-carboxymethylaminomethyl(34) synthesis GTPase MnmE [Myxococcales bacterium]